MVEQQRDLFCEFSWTGTSFINRKPFHWNTGFPDNDDDEEGDEGDDEGADGAVMVDVVDSGDTEAKLPRMTAASTRISSYSGVDGTACRVSRSLYDSIFL